MPPQQPQPTLLPSCFANSGRASIKRNRPSLWPRQAALTASLPRRVAGISGYRAKSFADDVREGVEPDTIRGKGVVAENGPVGIDQDEWCGDFPPCVLAGLVAKVFIEFENARAKGGPVVRGAERLYPIFRFEWHASPHGNLLAVLPAARRKIGPGAGGFRMASAKASVSRAVKINMARFSIVRSPAPSALWRTKSVMVRPSKSAAR